jgi:hypothetical protein
MIQEKIGEAIGLETAAQQTVETQHSRGLLKPDHMKKLSKMQENRNKRWRHWSKSWQIVMDLTRR